MELPHTTPTSAPLPASTKKGVNPMMITLVSILLSTVLGVVGQLLLKQGMSQMGALQFAAMNIPTIMFKMATSPWVIGGLLVYCSGTFFWLMVLNRVPLSFSYPFIALGIVVGTLAAWGIFRENIPPTRWVGLAFVCLGMIVVAKS